MKFVEGNLPGDDSPSTVDVCLVVCENRYSKAIENSETDGDYDLYSTGNAECTHINIGFSHNAIHAIGKTARVYTIVDECSDCSYEVGEQGYNFECPLPATD